MQRIVCTTGTSIFTNARQQLGQDAGMLSRSTLIRRYCESLKSECQNQKDFLVRLCAETNSLSRLGLEPGDEVVLLHTETDDGRECAEALRDVVKDEFRVNTKILPVEGLQVADADRFRKIGIHNLFRILREACVDWWQEDQDHGKVILNATGGFKAVVPYLTLFGVLHRIDVVYIFERSDMLIRLPPLPIHFDYERLSQARSALQLLKREGVLKKEQFFQAIPGLSYHERPWFESLLEEDQAGDVTPSAFGMLILETWEKDTKQIFLSPEANESYQKSSGETRKRLDHFLGLLQDPVWRNGRRHTFQNTDLDVYKLPHQAERIAGFVRGSCLYVCVIYCSHDKYERDLPRRSRNEFESRLKEFVPWIPPAEEYISPTDAPDVFQEPDDDQ
jgi:putative CRISPR-associated protein (TIGR02619 family)